VRSLAVLSIFLVPIHADAVNMAYGSNVPIKIDMEASMELGAFKALPIITTTTTEPVTTTTDPPPTTVPVVPSTSAPPVAVASGGIWDCIAHFESGGNPAENTGNGYFGAFQFTLSTWRSAGGGPGLPSDYSYATQLAVAEVVQQQQGWGAWPNTSRMCGV
jgi:resuscitation-promoting factor RpfB